MTLSEVKQANSKVRIGDLLKTKDEAKKIEAKIKAMQDKILEKKT